jgi:membrane dipeptidase
MFRICDLHCDTALLWQAGTTLEDKSLHVSLPYLREGNVGLQVFAVYVPGTLPKDQCFSFATQGIARFQQEVAKYSSRIALCRNSYEVEAAAASGKVAALLAVESGDAIEKDLKNLEALYNMGVRLMTLIHSKSNDWVISSQDEKPSFDGLSGFGEDVVAAMNDLGMIVDVSHAHDRTTERVLERSRVPIVASHSCMYGICPIARNINDDLIRGISAGDGVIGVSFQPPFLDCAFKEIVEKRGKDVFSELDRLTRRAGADGAKLGKAWMKFTRDFKNMRQQERVPLEKLLQHIEYLVDLVGEDHAAFGSDFDGIPDTPIGLEDCRGFANILEGLRLRGYSRRRLEKICWSNFFRVFKSVCG